MTIDQYLIIKGRKLIKQGYNFVGSLVSQGTTTYYYKHKPTGQTYKVCVSAKNISCYVNDTLVKLKEISTLTAYQETEIQQAINFY